MNRRLILAAATAGAAAGYLARCELARRHVPRGDRWLLRAVREVSRSMLPGERADTLIVAVRGLDGRVTAWSMRRPDTLPAAVFRAGPVPDDARELDGWTE